MLLRELIKTQHPKGGMQTASGCVCGYHAGGPCGSAACRILDKLMEAGKEVRCGRMPPRDPSVCSHEREGKLTIWEYLGKIICEQCRSEVK